MPSIRQLPAPPFVRLLFVLSGLLFHPGTPVIAAGPPVRPNVLVIIADDLGWNDISLHGGATPTPHIDSLASAGMSFRNLIVNPVCSPTRAAPGRAGACAGVKKQAQRCGLNEIGL